jgi:hypothetical protein
MSSQIWLLPIGRRTARSTVGPSARRCLRVVIGGDGPPASRASDRWPGPTRPLLEDHLTRLQIRPSLLRAGPRHRLQHRAATRDRRLSVVFSSTQTGFSTRPSPPSTGHGGQEPKLIAALVAGPDLPVKGQAPPAPHCGWTRRQRLSAASEILTDSTSTYRPAPVGAEPKDLGERPIP